MSEIPPPKKPKFARGQSDGKYLGAHGPTNKFQAQWFEHTALEGQPQRKDWLSDGGVDDKNSYQAHCSICPAFFQCRKQAILAHEDSKAHKQKAAAWLVKQQARAGWQVQLNKGADYTALQRATKAADPKLHTQFACVFKTLQQGRPITDVCSEEAFLKFIKAPNVPDTHWHHNAG